MKRGILILGLCMVCAGGAMAQIVRENEMAMVYYMPQTIMDVDVTYTIETEEAGPYHMYAKKYLGTDDAIKVNSSKAEIVEVNVCTRSQADMNRPVKVVPESGINMQLLCINTDGTLYGYNVHRFARSYPTKDANEKTDKTKTSIPSVLPLTEEALRGTTPAQAAESVAKQIYRIREARMYLLSGEIEKAPADGSGLETALKELSRQEKQLVQLFTGKRTRKTIQKTITYIPSKSEEQPLLYFSLENGITAEEDASALPLMIQFVARKQMLAPASEPSGKKAPQPSQICYNVPGYGSYTITYDGETLYEGSLPVAQFGVTVPLERSLFSGQTLPKIYFNQETGNIQSIEK